MQWALMVPLLLMLLRDSLQRLHPAQYSFYQPAACAAATALLCHAAAAAACHEGIVIMMDACSVSMTPAWPGALWCRLLLLGWQLGCALQPQQA